MKILFWLYRSRLNAQGKAPIMMRLTHDGQRHSFSTNLFTEAKLWDSKRQRVKGSQPVAISFNDVLNSLTATVWNKYAEARKTSAVIDLNEIKLCVTGKSKEIITLMEAIQYHINFLQTRVGLDVSVNTIKKYQTLLKKVGLFLKYAKRKDPAIKLLKVEFIEALDLYMRKTGGLSQNGVAKNMQQLKRVIKICIRNQWLSADPFQNYSCAIIPSDRGFLAFAEVKKIQSHDFLSNRLNRVRDIFIFCCYTGLSYADVSKLQSENLSVDEHDVTWLRINRSKTGTGAIVPLMAIPKAIIKSYENALYGTSNLLPMISNQNLNKYLKEIGATVGIGKRLSMHLARHTFATTLTLEKGVDISTVSKMLGHTNIKTTQIYSKVTQLKIANDMKILLAGPQ